MAYDMHGPWEPQTDHHAPLYKRPWEEENYDNYVDYTVQHLLSHGLPPEKLNLGIPLYGQSWTLQTIEIDANPTPPARATGSGSAGSLTKQDGFLGYNEICKFVVSNNWQTISDPDMLNGPYSYSLLPPYTWVGYDDPEMAAYKASYVLEKKLGGAMVWDMSTDDFRASCSSQKNPILTAIAQTLSGTTTTPAAQLTEPSTTSTQTSEFSATAKTNTIKWATVTRYITTTPEPFTKRVRPTQLPNSATSPKSYLSLFATTISLFIVFI